MLNSFQNNQYAYRPGVSTETALHHLVARLERAVFNKQFALCAFIDLVGAFSNIKHDAIRVALNHFKVNRCLTRWIINMLRSQSVTACLDSVSVAVRTTRGTPQGGAASPTLFNMVMDVVVRWVKLGECLPRTCSGSTLPLSDL